MKFLQKTTELGKIDQNWGSDNFLKRGAIVKQEISHKPLQNLRQFF